MKSNYRPIGDFIELVDVRNRDLRVTKLLGLSITKEFIPSVANIIGTNMANYKIIKKNQFACSIMQVRRDKKMPIALLKEVGEAIISQAYPVFEVINTDELLPDYLMMWFSRSEFDRHACFLAVGGVRGSLEWEDFLDMELPIPPIEKQRAIVEEYNTIVNRIKLSEQLNQKLEETAQALYKHWFVDFEFPDIEGKPYKSSGGRMMFNKELDKEIPERWVVDSFDSFDLDISDGNYSGKYPKSSEFLNQGVPFIRGTDFKGYFINPSNFRYISKEKHSQLRKGHTKKGDVLMTTRGASIGNYAFISDKFIDVNINSQLVRLNGGEDYPQLYLGLLFSSREFYEVLEGAITGSAQPQLSITNLLGMRLIKPKISVVKKFCKNYNLIQSTLMIRYDGIILLEKATELLLAKMSKVETLQVEQVI